jgi:hypothetical protein
MLAIIINRAKNNEQIAGVVPHIVDNGLSILQYIDDTLIFMDDNLEKAKNLKLLLCAFEQLSGWKINFHKSKNFYFGNAKNFENVYSRLWCRAYLFKYLGIPMHYKRLNNKDYKEIEHQIEKKLGSWKGKLLSVGGRLVLKKSILTSMVLFMLSLF